MDFHELTTSKETSHNDQRIITLTPEFSKIEGLQPPLTDETKNQIIEYTPVLNAFIQDQYVAILEDAQQRFLQKAKAGIGFRAIMVSKDGEVQLITNDQTKYNIPDIHSVLKSGAEKTGDEVLVSTQGELDKEVIPTSHPRVIQYLGNGVKTILSSEKAEARKLTPAILVYDLDQLVQVSGYRHRFKQSGDRSKAILGLYIVGIDAAKKN